MPTVVIGYVPKPEGNAALAAGIAEAKRLDAAVVVVHTRPAAEGEDLAGLRDTLDQSGLPHEVRSGVGIEAADDILAAAEERSAELIVLGLRRRSATGKLLLGTNAQRVLLDAPCPVLTVKP